MRSKIFGAALTGIVLLISCDTWAQTYAESALQFSRTMPTGSARVLGMGGAQTALGGDYSLAYSNPAGLGMYNRSEITLSPGLSFWKTNASYLKNTDQELKPHASIPGFSLVFHFPREDGGKYIGGTLGISLSRTNDFNQSISYHGTTTSKNDPGSSIIDSFIDIANGTDASQFDQGNSQYNSPTGLAYYNYLIGPMSSRDQNAPNDQYFSDVQASSYPAQQENIQTTGYTNQWNISYGGNYSDKLFFGIGLGISSLNYKNTKVYSESFSGDPYLNNLSLQEDLSVRGTGLNATFGVTGRPVNFLQIGASLTTPTVYSLSEKYDADMTTNWKNFDYYGDGSKMLNNEEAYTDVVQSTYSLTTPMKFSTGLAFIISKWGIISGDVDLINPSQAKYSSTTTGLTFSGDNNDIRSSYKQTLNVRLGGEFRYEIFRLRAGYGIQGNSYKAQYDNNDKITTFSAGAGVRLKKFFVDLAVTRSNGNNLYSPYYGAPVVSLSNYVTRGIITAGFTF